MTETDIPPLEHAVHTTNAWIKDLMHELGWQDRHRAYRALREVLHALRDRLPVSEVADLGAQLPMLVRGLYYEGWVPADAPSRARTKHDFLAPIAAAFCDDPDVDAEAIAWAVFRLLKGRVSAGEIADVEHVLPWEIRSLWPV